MLATAAGLITRLPPAAEQRRTMMTNDPGAWIAQDAAGVAEAEQRAASASARGGH